MRIAAAPVTAKRCNEFMILYNKGLLFHTSPRPSHGANAEPPAILGVGAALRRSGAPDHVTIICLEDGEETAPPTAFAN